MDKQLSPYLLACAQKETKTVPIWLMRQAGRYMKNYMAIRQRHDFNTLLRSPDLACEITLQPVKEFAPDAAIIFADILPLLNAMGLDVAFKNGDGPVIENPLKDEADVDKLHSVDPERDLGFTLEAIKITKAELEKLGTPLIGFSGAPFTLAYYATGGERTGINLLKLMHTRPLVYKKLMEKLVDAISIYLRAQIDCGVDALQLFDSWAGMLSPREFEEFVFPYVYQILEPLRNCGRPVTYFSTQTSAYVDILNRLPCDVLSVDWRIDIAKAFREKSPRHALQGNLSPHVLLGSEKNLRATIRSHFDALLTESPSLRGYIFNLGHGIHKETPIENVHALFDEVRRIRISA